MHAAIHTLTEVLTRHRANLSELRAGAKVLRAEAEERDRRADLAETAIKEIEAALDRLGVEVPGNPPSREVGKPTEEKPADEKSADEKSADEKRHDEKKRAKSDDSDAKHHHHR